MLLLHHNKQLPQIKLNAFKQFDHILERYKIHLLLSKQHIESHNLIKLASNQMYHYRY